MHRAFCTSLDNALMTVNRAIRHTGEVSLINCSGSEEGYFVEFDGFVVLSPQEFQWVTEAAQSVEVISPFKEALAQPAPVQEFGLTRERFNALEAEITTLQADWLFALKEVVRLKAAQPAQEPVAHQFQTKFTS